MQHPSPQTNSNQQSHLNLKVTAVAGIAHLRGYREGYCAQFDDPRGLCVDSKGVVYVCDWGNGVVRSILTEKLSTKQVQNSIQQDLFPGEQQTAHNCFTSLLSGHNQSSTNSVFQSPQGICLNNNEKFLYVSDYRDMTIKRIKIESGSTELYAGVPLYRGHKDSTTKQSLFNCPFGLVCDRYDNLYVCDL